MLIRLLIALVIIGLVIALVRLLINRGKADKAKRIEHNRDDDEP